MSFQSLYIWGNIFGVTLGLIIAISVYNYYKKLNQIGKGMLWAIGSVAICLLLVNGLIKYVEIKDDYLRKEAYELLDKRYQDRGDGEKESYNNLELVVTPKKEKRYTSYKIYVANFNNQYTYNGKIEITIKDEEDDKVFTHITKKTIIKPGEKKELENVNYDTWNSRYSWKWLGKLKK